MIEALFDAYLHHLTSEPARPSEALSALLLVWGVAFLAYYLVCERPR